eukprot:774756-Rhodomonas_salina.2
MSGTDLAYGPTNSEQGLEIATHPKWLSDWYCLRYLLRTSYAMSAIFYAMFGTDWYCLRHLLRGCYAMSAISYAPAMACPLLTCIISAVGFTRLLHRQKKTKKNVAVYQNALAVTAIFVHLNPECMLCAMLAWRGATLQHPTQGNTFS